MTYLDHMLAHETENFSFCKPYTNNDEDRFLIMYDGEPLEIHAPGIDAYRHDGTLRIYMEVFARDLAGDDYDFYHGYSDEQIALKYLHECGCAHCPARHDCEAMRGEVEE